MRRPAAVVTALVLLAEAVGIVAINGILATFADGQSMSLAGLDPDAMVTGTWAMGIAFGLYLAACAAVSLLAGVRDRAPGRAARILLVTCAITHGVLSAVTVGLVGWGAFAFLTFVLGLIVLTLVAYGEEHGAKAPPEGAEADAADASANGAAPA
ncbi:hypothetical protein [Streptomyces sp. MUM 178J]|uniref:hypothetical protein n=1 Tax=Streptomyces sp. MUM 178J TaxID=2791991 RepID=UPI001F040B16|nr:hypothetical protein [Streptomyces sp. MUM 178J]WRQ83470.1 hypothetical protein I3F59_021490 [Streptomyces sp. MUM 178J]